jgi:hypothetical protein
VPTVNGFKYFAELTAQGEEICYRLFDAGKTRYAVLPMLIVHTDDWRDVVYGRDRRCCTTGRQRRKIDTSSAAGELVFHLFGAIAHFEHRLIAERTKNGIAAAPARCKRLGRQPIDADKVQAALKLVEAGLSPRRLRANLALGGPRSTAKSRQRASAGARAETLLRCFRRPARMFSGFDRAIRGTEVLVNAMVDRKPADDSELHHEWTVPIGELKSTLEAALNKIRHYILEAAVRFTFSVIVSQLTNVALPSSSARADRNRRPRRTVGGSFGPSLKLAWRQSHGTRQFTDGVQLRRKCHALSPPSDLVRSDLDALGKRTGSGMGGSLRSRGTTLLGGQKGGRVCGLF